MATESVLVGFDGLATVYPLTTYLLNSRVPFPIAVRRKASGKLLIGVTTSLAEADVLRELEPGDHFELCDIEGETALLRIGPDWYRAHIDDVLNHSKPRTRTNGVL